MPKQEVAQICQLPHKFSFAAVKQSSSWFCLLPVNRCITLCWTLVCSWSTHRFLDLIWPGSYGVIGRDLRFVRCLLCLLLIFKIVWWVWPDSIFPVLRYPEVQLVLFGYPAEGHGWGNSWLLFWLLWPGLWYWIQSGSYSLTSWDRKLMTRHLLPLTGGEFTPTSSERTCGEYCPPHQPGLSGKVGENSCCLSDSRVLCYFQ